MLDLAVAVATGGSWLGRYPIDDPGPVVVFWGEGDDADLVRRLDAICEDRGVDPDTLDVVSCCRVPHLGRAHHLDLFRAQVDDVARALLISAVVKSRATDAATEETTVVTELDIIGGSIPDRTVRVVRRVRADDPTDLDSPLHVRVDATETETTPESSDLTPAETKMHAALVAIATAERPATQRTLVDHVAAEHGHGLKRETASRALNRRAELDLCDGAQPAKGAAKLWWPTGEQEGV